MPYTDFSMDSIHRTLGLAASRVELFPGIEPLAVPVWLTELLDRGHRQALVSEKARSEFIVVPILLACQDLSPLALSIFSGQRLDVDADRGLVGECDFIIAEAPPLPGLQAPLMLIVEAKKNDIEAGLWQCIAQMVAARLFNERAGRPVDSIFGCVTTGEAWQFLRVSPELAQVDSRRYYIDNVGLILSAFDRALGHPGPAAMGPE